MMEERVCSCGALQRLATEHSTTVAYDQDCERYFLLYENDRSGGPVKEEIRYCMSCGGRAPFGERTKIYHEILFAERARLRAMTRDIRMMDDARLILGEPDREESEGVVTPETDGEPPRYEEYRYLVYSRLSEKLEVVISDRRGVAYVSFAGKPIEDPETTPRR